MTAAATSTKSTCRIRRRARENQGFEWRPPRCLNCDHYQPPTHGVPSRQQYTAPRCKLGKFAVEPYSICDQWHGANGDRLEEPTP